MAVYQMTPRERRARAIALAERRRDVREAGALANYQKAVGEMQSVPTSEPNAPKGSGNVLTRSAATVGDVLLNVVEGAVSSVEGIGDIGAGIVGGIGGLFDEDFRDEVRDFISWDITSDVFGRDGDDGRLDWTWGADLSRNGYLKDDSVVHDIARGMGGMLPSVAISVATGGLVNPALATAGKIASSAVFMGGAAGKEMEDKLNRGAGYGQALGYGLTAGAIEGLTEQIGGVVMGGSTELAGSAIGKLLIKKGLDKSVRSGLGRAAFTVASEGLEEVLSDLIDPINKKVWGIDAVDPTDWGEVVRGLPKTFFVGGAVGLLMGGLESGVSAIKNSDKGGYRYNKVANEMTTINDLLKANEAVKTSDRFGQDYIDRFETKINERIAESTEAISETARKMTPEQRANLLREAPIITSFMHEDGTVDADFRTALDERIKSGRATNATASVFDTKVTEDALRAAEKTYAEKFSRKVTLTADDTALSETERADFAEIARDVRAFGDKLGRDLNLVVVNADDGDVNAFVDGNEVFVTREKLSDGAWTAPLAHEVYHLMQEEDGTVAFAKLFSDKYEEAKAEVVRSYGRTAEEVDGAFERGKNGVRNFMEARDAETYDEVMAIMTEKVLGSREALGRLARNNEGVFRKLWNGVKDFVSSFGKRETEDVARMKRTVSLFEDVMSESRERNELIGRAAMAGDRQYERERKEYLSLSEEERPAWLEEHPDFEPETVGEGTRFSFAGEKSETSDKSALSRAEEMEKDGASSEEIRQATGWFRGYDEKWRYEIDDSKLQISSMALRDSGNVVLLGDIYDIQRKGELYDAYPELARVKVYFEDGLREKEYGDAYYSPTSNKIVVDKSYKDDPNELRNLLVHEIQHIVQEIEGFTTGTDTKDFAVYLNTAGEVEAYDVGDRADYSEEDRKNIRPDIDRKDVIFAEISDKSNSIRISEDGRAVVVVNDDITKNATSDKEVVSRVKEAIGRFKYIPIKNNKIWFLLDTKKEVTFSKYTKWIRKNDPDVYADKMRLFNHPSEIILATTDYINEGLSHTRKDNIIDFARGKILLDVLGKKYEAEVVIGFTNDGKCELHDVVKLSHTTFKYKKMGALSTISQNSEHLQKRLPIGNSISQSSELSTENAKKVSENSSEDGETRFSRTVESSRDIGNGGKKVNTDSEKRTGEAAKAEKEEYKAYDQEKYREDMEAIRKVAEESRKYSEVFYNITKNVDFLRACTNRKYAQEHNIGISTDILNDETFQTLAKTASNLFAGKNLSPKKVREAVFKLASFYNEENQIFTDYINDVQTIGSVNSITDSLAADMDVFLKAYDEETNSFSSEKLTVRELRAINNILSFTKKLYTSYDTIYEDGKKLQLSKMAQEYDARFARVINSKAESKSKIFGWLKDKVWMYNAATSSPLAVGQHMDGYQDGGFMTHTVERLIMDSAKQARKAIELTTQAEQFFVDHKKYARRLTKERIAFNGFDGAKILVGEAIDIYLQATQDNGKLTLYGENGGGFTYTNASGKTSTNALKFASEDDVARLYQSFSEEDKRFIEIIKEVYRECGELKKTADIARMGFSNVIGGEYYPLSRDQRYIRSNVGDARARFNGIPTLNNLSMNKKRSERAQKIPLSASDVYSKMLEHVREATMYEAFGQDIDNFNRLYNARVTGEYGGRTLRLDLTDIWDGAEKYIQKYLADVQGVSTSEQSDIARLFGALRSNYAQAQLGANIKVIASQTASLPTVLAYIDADCLAKGLTMGAGKNVNAEMDKYSDEAFVRNHDRVIVKAETLSDKVSKLGEKSTALIQASDRLTISQIWNACQVQIAKDEGLAVGTEENKVAAGKLLDRIILLTQPTYSAANRSALQRSNNEIAKSFAMFTSVPMKQVSMLISAVDKVRALTAQKKAGFDVSDADIKAAKKELGRKFGAVFAANAMYAAICQLVKHIFDRDEEEDNDGRNVPEQMAMQFLETNVSMFPILKELYGYFVNGYDIESMPLGTVNDMLGAIGDLYGVGKAAVSGDLTQEQLNRALRNGVFSAGMFFGLPTRNVYNTVFGLTKRFSPEAAYNAFGSKFEVPKVSKISAAYKMGKVGLAASYADNVMIARGLDVGRGQAELLSRLYAAGYSLPRGVPDSVTVDGEEVALTKNQQATWSAYYSVSASVVDEAIAGGAFEGLDDAVIAAAVKGIYDMYFDLGGESIVGESKNSLFARVVDIPTFAVNVAVAKSFTADVGRDGNPIAGSKKKKVQQYVNSLKLTAAEKYLIMGYLGYKNAKGEAKVSSYLDKVKLTAAQKKKLMEYAGY